MGEYNNDPNEPQASPFGPWPQGSQMQSPQYGAYGQVRSQQMDPVIAALLGRIGGQQQNDPNQMAAFLQAMRPHPAVHLGIGGGEITPENPMGNTGGNPFANGFFKPQVAAPPMNYLAGTSHPDPTQMAMIQGSQSIHQGFTGAPNPWIMPTGVSQGQIGGMLNPQLPDAQKYTDSNFWSAVGQVPQNGWLPGAAVRDETGRQYGTPKFHFPLAYGSH